MSYLGELAALGSAAAWAVSTGFYRRVGDRVPPLVLNLVKGLVALPLLGLVLLVWPSAMGEVAAWPVALLAVSGAVGIGVGDTAFFAALNRMGEGRTLLMVETLAPPLAAGVALAALDERLPLPAWLGIAVTLAGVAWVVAERSGGAGIDPAAARRGVACGVLASVCQAVGVVLSRAALTQSEIGPVLSTMVRIAGGVMVLLVWMPATGAWRFPSALRRRSTWPPLGVAILLGTMLGLWLHQVALQQTGAGVVQTLTATSSLMVLPLMAWRGERVTARAVVGSLIAVAGVALLLRSA